jgi:hypothetical protein
MPHSAPDRSAASPCFAQPCAPASAAARRVALLALLLAAAPAAAQDQTWYGLGGSFVSPGDHWGRSVALLPDMNGDGHADMVIGAPQDLGYGSAYLISGKSPHLKVWQWHGSEADSTFGQTVAYAGLVGADSVPDVLISAPRQDVFTGFFVLADAGVVQVRSGASGGVLRTFLGRSTSARFGDALAGGQDVTGDGRADILIGAPHWDATDEVNCGYADLYDGETGALVKRHEGSEAGALFGWTVALLGDLTGDGRSEYAIGAPGEDKTQVLPFPQTLVDAGFLRVYDGATHAVLISKNGSANDELGTAVCALGDADGDGVRELLVGAPGGDGGDGYAVHYEGSAGTFVRGYGGTGVGERFGTWVSRAGDANKDGHEELAIGATNSNAGAGFLRVFEAEDGSLLETYGFAPGSGAGQHAAFDGGRDVNDDGWPDLLVGLPNLDTAGADAGGAVCLGQLDYQGDIGFSGPHVAQFSIYGGQLESGSEADLKLTNVPPGGAAFLLLSAGFQPSSFQGGTLAPKLAGSFLVSFPFLPTSTLLVPGVPGGGGPATIYGQFIVTGYGGSQPVGLSNALVIVLQP